VLDFNRVNISASSVSVGINEAIERAALRSIRQPRSYLGASIVGHECLRRVQYDWFCDPVHAARTYEIFERGHYFEQRSRQHLVDAGFRFAPSLALAFSAADGLLRGHADGIIIAGPDLPGLYLIYPLIWEHKALGAKGWKKLACGIGGKSWFVGLEQHAAGGIVARLLADRAVGAQERGGDDAGQDKRLLRPFHFRN